MIRLVSIALAEVGTREEGGNNQGQRIREYQQATWLEPGPWPWCAAFVVWCLKQRLDDPEPFIPYTDAKRRDPSLTPNSWRFRSAAAYDLEKWGTKAGAVLLPPTAVAHPGDLVVYDFSHCGLVVTDNGEAITTVEGNTSKPRTGGSQRDGDMVALKVRNKAETVRRFVRLSP